MKNEKERVVLTEEEENFNQLLKVHSYKIGAYQLDVASRLLSINGEVTKLTNKEWQLLVLFAANANVFLERKYALKMIWKDDNYYNSRSMDVYICKLRKLLKDDSNVMIINTHAKGFKMITPA